MIYCKHCYYDLRKTSAGRCPECGHVFDPADSRSFSRERTRETLRYRLLMLAPILMPGIALSALILGFKSIGSCGCRFSLPTMGPWTAVLAAMLGGCFAAAAWRWDFRVGSLFQAFLWASGMLWIVAIALPGFLVTGCP